MIFYRPIDDVQINFPLYRYPSVGFEFQNETLINVFSLWWLFAIISHILRLFQKGFLSTKKILNIILKKIRKP